MNVLLLFIFHLYAFDTDPLCPELSYENFTHTSIVNTREQKFILSWDDKKLARPYIVDIPSHYQNIFFDFIRKIKKTEFQRLLPNKLRIIYYKEKIPKAHNANILFCKYYQKENEFVLVVDKNTVENPELFSRLLAHESFHYFSYILKTDFPNWLEEGLAVYFQEKLYNIRPYSLINAHLNHSPWLSFKHENLEGELKNSQSFYGQVLLYLHFIDKNISGDAISSLVFSDSNWRDALEAYFKVKWDTFEESFIDFQIAKYIRKRDDYVLNANEDFIYRYTILDSTYMHIKNNMEPIDFDPGPLSAFIPKDWTIYQNREGYLIHWIEKKDFYPIRVSDSPIDNDEAFPLMIRLK